MMVVKAEDINSEGYFQMKCRFYSLAKRRAMVLVGLIAAVQLMYVLQKRILKKTVWGTDSTED